MINKRLSLFLLLIFFLCSISVQNGFAQNLSLENCYELARKNYPLIKQMDLIEKSKEYSVSNVAKGYWPRFIIGGQASYQSDVTKVNVPIPGLAIPSPDKDQYKIYAEISQPLTDLRMVSHQSELIKHTFEIEKQQIEVELYQLNERINQLFFSILILDAQIEQLEILKKDISLGIDKTETAIKNGVALESDADLIHAEILNVNQQKVELESSKEAFMGMLSQFINQNIDEKTQFERPQKIDLQSEINRPELHLFESKAQIFALQNKLLSDQGLPNFSLFLQGGFGRPALNMLKNDFDPFYIGGIRFAWNISHFYTLGKERELLSIQKQQTNVQKETFLFNTYLLLNQQNVRISKYEKLIANDREIIRLREQVKKSAENRLNEGTVTSSDYLQFVHAEDKARQDLILHEIQLLMEHYNYKTTSGN